MSRIYRTKDGDMVDAICHAHYSGAVDPQTSLVLDANPGLAALGPVLPKGLLITLPDLPETQSSDPIRLWS